MNTKQAIQQTILSIFVALVILGSTALAQPDFFDDFSDGDPTDGSPVTWHPIFVWDGTGFTLTPEGLDVAGALLSNPDGTIPVYHDVAITTELKRHANDTGAEWASGFLFRYNANWTNGYWMEVRSPNLFLLGHNPSGELTRVGLPFDVDEQDFTIRMEANGPQINGFCWAAGQPIPEEPQISVRHTGASVGRIRIYGWTLGATAIFVL
jgi:hypothetical protein